MPFDGPLIQTELAAESLIFTPDELAAELEYGGPGRRRDQLTAILLQAQAYTEALIGRLAVTRNVLERIELDWDSRFHSLALAFRDVQDVTGVRYERFGDSDITVLAADRWRRHENKLYPANDSQLWPWHYPSANSAFYYPTLAAALVTVEVAYSSGIAADRATALGDPAVQAMRSDIRALAVFLFENPQMGLQAAAEKVGTDARAFGGTYVSSA